MNLPGYIDHTILKQDCTQSDIKRVCEEAKTHQFKAVCIPPYFVKEAFNQLDRSEVKVATVIGFPMGYATTPSKVEEIKRAIDDGADELDVVVNICAIKSGNWNYARNDIDSMTTAAHIKGKVIKIILETGLLKKEEIVKLCQICQEIGTDFVKTSTGFGGAGADVPTVQLLRNSLDSKIKIKASGGIRDREFALQLIDAGASRLGSSSGIQIIGE